MDRRTFLGALAVTSGSLSSGCLSSVPRPSGPRTPPTEPEESAGPADALVIADNRFEATDGGDLRVVFVVENRTGSEQSGTIRTTVEVDEPITKTAAVTVPPRGTIEEPVVFPVSREAFLSDGRFTARITVD